MKLFAWMKKHPDLTVIYACVFFCHLLFVFSPLTSSHEPPLPKKSIIINTYAIPKPKPKYASPKETPVLKKNKGETVAKIEKMQDKTKSSKELMIPKPIDKLEVDHVRQEESQLT